MTAFATLRRAGVLATALAALASGVLATGPAHAEVPEVHISKGYGILYLPMIVMEHEKLLEKQAKAAGLGDVKVGWLELDGGNVINDAMISGNLDIAAIGVPGFLTLWAKVKGNAKLEVSGLAGLSATSLYLNTNNPNIKSLKDFTAKDKIALPGIKTSLSAVVLQMAVAKEFGDDNYAKLDPMTVGLPHPEAYTSLVSGKTEVNSHLGSPPYSFMELENPQVHRVMNSVDVLGNISLDLVYAPKRFIDANPKLTAAFLAALEEADKLIADEPARAATIYVQSAKAKLSAEEVERMIKDPDTKFSTTPNGVMQFANFMGRVGSIKTKPANWQDLFIANVHSLPGS